MHVRVSVVFVVLMVSVSRAGALPLSEEPPAAAENPLEQSAEPMASRVAVDWLPFLANMVDEFQGKKQPLTYQEIVTRLHVKRLSDQLAALNGSDCAEHDVAKLKRKLDKERAKADPDTKLIHLNSKMEQMRAQLVLLQPAQQGDTPTGKKAGKGKAGKEQKKADKAVRLEAKLRHLEDEASRLQPATAKEA